MSEQQAASGHRLFEGAAIAGLLVAFGLPATLLLRDADPLLAATCGYTGIALFTGAIAARFHVITKPGRWRQLFANVLLASLVSLVFYLVFLVLYFI